MGVERQEQTQNPKSIAAAKGWAERRRKVEEGLADESSLKASQAARAAMRRGWAARKKKVAEGKLEHVIAPKTEDHRRNLGAARRRYFEQLAQIPIEEESREPLYKRSQSNKDNVSTGLKDYYRRKREMVEREQLDSSALTLSKDHKTAISRGLASYYRKRREAMAGIREQQARQFLSSLGTASEVIERFTDDPEERQVWGHFVLWWSNPGSTIKRLSNEYGVDKNALRTSVVRVVDTMDDRWNQLKTLLGPSIPQY